MAGKRQFQLTEQQQHALIEAYEKSSDGPARTRLQAVRLYSRGYSVEAITEITGCPRRTLLRWCQQYRYEGANGLTDKRLGSNRAFLSDERLDDICQKLGSFA
jgi:transposase